MQTDTPFHKLWIQLTHIQKRFIIALLIHPTKKAAAHSLGISASTVYHWPPIVDEVHDHLLADLFQAAWRQMLTAVTQAALIKTEGLRHEDPHIRQQAATEVLDRVLGRPPTAEPFPSPHPEEPQKILVRYIDESPNQPDPYPPLAGDS